MKAKKVTVGFLAYNLPKASVIKLDERLANCKNDDEIKAAFDAARDELKATPPDNGALAVLEGIRLEVEAIKHGQVSSPA